MLARGLGAQPKDLSPAKKWRMIFARDEKSECRVLYRLEFFSAFVFMELAIFKFPRVPTSFFFTPGRKVALLAGILGPVDNSYSPDFITILKSTSNFTRNRRR